MSTPPTPSSRASPPPYPSSPGPVSLAAPAMGTIPTTAWLEVTHPSPHIPNELYERPTIARPQSPSICRPVTAFMLPSLQEAHRYVEHEALTKGYFLRQDNHSDDPAITYLRCHKSRPLDAESSPPPEQDWCMYEVAIEAIRDVYWVRGVNDTHNHETDLRAVEQHLSRDELHFLRSELARNANIEPKRIQSVINKRRRKIGIARLADFVCDEAIVHEREKDGNGSEASTQDSKDDDGASGGAPARKKMKASHPPPEDQDDAAGPSPPPRRKYWPPNSDRWPQRRVC